MRGHEHALDWRKDWEVDLATRRASHRAGWVVEFDAEQDADGGMNGRCVAEPENMDAEQMMAAARILRQAGSIYGEALWGREDAED